jgi:hypothetical protein
VSAIIPQDLRVSQKLIPRSVARCKYRGLSSLPGIHNVLLEADTHNARAGWTASLGVAYSAGRTSLHVLPASTREQFSAFAPRLYAIILFLDLV